MELPAVTNAKVAMLRFLAYKKAQFVTAAGIITGMSQILPKDLKVDRTTFSVTSLTDDSGEKAYWFAQTPQERLKQVELLRRINYGTQATARLQRVFEVIER